MLDPLSFYKCLAEETRLKSLLLISLKGKLCVCDLTQALQLSQPKVSRHLSALKQCGLLEDERRGKWVFYGLSRELPEWARGVLAETVLCNSNYIAECLALLHKSSSAANCCA